MQRLKTFLAAEDGAVTVDFTVLTAVIVVVAVAVGALILAGASDAATSIAQSIIDYLHS
jgi:Flp pilus assembly pilin Flp